MKEARKRDVNRFGAPHGRHPHGALPDHLVPGPRGGETDRARRGEVKVVLLDMLSDGPLHGYDLMQALEKRSGGRYVPSPGTIYPTLNKLEEFGLVSSERRMERRLFRLTPAGQAHLEASAEEVARFWLRWGKPNVSAEVDAEHQAIAQEWAALDELINQRLLAGLQRLSLEQVRQIRAALAGSRRTVEEVLGPRA